MDKEAIEHIHETMQSARRLTVRVNCPHMEKERRCTSPREVQRDYSAASHYKITLDRILNKRLRERIEHELGENSLVSE